MLNEKHVDPKEGTQQEEANQESAGVESTQDNDQEKGQGSAEEEGKEL